MKSFDIFMKNARLRAARFTPALPRSGMPAVVFLHEALGSIGQWKAFPRQLCEALGCEGFVYDRRGHGASDPLDAPRRIDFYHEECETLRTLLAEQHIERPVLFGHSDGGTIALAFATHFPGEARAVVAEAAHVFIEDVTLAGIRAARDAFERGGLREKLGRYHGNNTDGVFKAWADTWLDPRARDWHMLDDLRSVSDPVLVVQGEDDQYGSIEQVRAIEQRCGGPTRSLLLPSCGHVPHLEKRDTVIEAVVSFLQNVVFESRGMHFKG